MTSLDDPSRYLACTPTLDCDHPRIQQIVAEARAAVQTEAEARAVVQAEADAPADPLDSQAALATWLFRYARDRVAYSPYVPAFRLADYRASGTLERGGGYCVQKAVVLATLARAARIPARLEFVDLRNHQAPAHLVALLGTDLFVYHCYGSLWLGERWLRATPAFDRDICETHDLPLVEFDGRSDAILPERDARGRRFAEYVKRHGVYGDVPLDPLLARWREVYGDERVQGWMDALAVSPPAC